MNVEEMEGLSEVVTYVTKEKDKMFYEVLTDIKSELAAMRLLLEDIKRNTRLSISPS